jgi:protein-disulfide isomerase
MKNPWTIVGIVALVLIGGSIWYSGVVSAKNNEGITFTSHIKGNAEAVTKLVEYSDFQCPSCASFQPALQEIMTEYGDSLSFEYKHYPLPLHKFAEPAARAAEAAAQQDAFFAYHDKLFENQANWSKSPNPTVLFMQYATELNLDIDKFKRQMNSSLVREKVRASGREAREMGITGTPTFYLNGKKMVFKSYEEFKSQIAQAINPEVDFMAEGATTTNTTNSAPVQFGI